MFKEIQLNPRPVSPPWGNYDFSKPSLIAFALSEHGDLLLAAAGGHALLEIEEWGFTTLDELQLEPPNTGARGLWVWEGKYVYSGEGEDATAEPEGIWRRPTVNEAYALSHGLAPWNTEDWVLNEISASQIDD